MQLFAINQLDKQRLNGKHAEALMVDDSYDSIMMIFAFLACKIKFFEILKIGKKSLTFASSSSSLVAYHKVFIKNLYSSVVVERIMKIVFAKLNDRQCTDYGMAMVK
ncbi:hypothetical protein T12_4307 [Trichinella patagoniensis]|uniref:Uncharacterized protein n=1 Tax=Trichinella patagoniensis TaxID=990121 RepID=A0A0V0ZWM0_9BILA|nr:hypothetical protein T12_4307 [Trichinella patagoniensis]